MYYIRCETPGENVLTQKLLLKKGFRWASGSTEPMFKDSGMVLVLRGELIYWKTLDSEDPEHCVELGWGELSRLETPSLKQWQVLAWDECV